MSSATRALPNRPQLGTTGLVYLALVGLVLVAALLVALQGGNLFSRSNTVDALTRSSLLGFIAIGQTFVILCRSLDLSVGYVVALSSLVGATTMAGDPSRIPWAVAVTLGVAALIGLANGVIVAKLKVNPFITTLGMGLIIKGYLDTQYRGPAGDVPAAFQGFGYTRIGVIPVSTAVMLALAVAAVLLLRRTRFGYHVYAVGGDAEVARMSGIRTDRIMISTHVLCSVCAGIAGLLIAARFGTGSALVYGSGYDLESIAAVVLGGTYLLGGRGGIGGTIAGVLILAVLDTTFNVLQVDPFFKDVLRGAIIIFAVAIYARRQLERRATRTRFGGDPPPGDPGGAPTPEDPSTGAQPDAADEPSVVSRGRQGDTSREVSP